MRFPAFNGQSKSVNPDLERYQIWMHQTILVWPCCIQAADIGQGTGMKSNKIRTYTKNSNHLPPRLIFSTYLWIISILSITLLSWSLKLRQNGPHFADFCEGIILIENVNVSYISDLLNEINFKIILDPLFNRMTFMIVLGHLCTRWLLFLYWNIFISDGGASVDMGMIKMRP